MLVLATARRRDAHLPDPSRRYALPTSRAGRAWSRCRCTTTSKDLVVEGTNKVTGTSPCCPPTSWTRCSGWKRPPNTAGPARTITRRHRRQHLRGGAVRRPVSRWPTDEVDRRPQAGVGPSADLQRARLHVAGPDFPLHRVKVTGVYPLGPDLPGSRPQHHRVLRHGHQHRHCVVHRPDPDSSDRQCLRRPAQTAARRLRPSRPTSRSSSHAGRRVGRRSASRLRGTVDPPVPRSLGIAVRLN